MAKMAKGNRVGPDFQRNGDFAFFSIDPECDVPRIESGRSTGGSVNRQMQDVVFFCRQFQRQALRQRQELVREFPFSVKKPP